MLALFATSFIQHQATRGNIQVSLFFVLILFIDYSITDIVPYCCFCSGETKCFYCIRGEERKVLLNNISKTMTHPLGIENTALCFEVTLPPGALNIDIQVRNVMCDVHQVNNSDKDFPLRVNDIIVSMNNIPMAKSEGDIEKYREVFRVLGTHSKKVVILRYTTM